MYTSTLCGRCNRKKAFEDKEMCFSCRKELSRVRIKMFKIDSKSKHYCSYRECPHRLEQFNYEDMKIYKHFMFCSDSCKDDFITFQNKIEQ